MDLFDRHLANITQNQSGIEALNFNRLETITPDGIKMSPEEIAKRLEIVPPAANPD